MNRATRLQQVYNRMSLPQWHDSNVRGQGVTRLIFPIALLASVYLLAPGAHGAISSDVTQSGSNNQATTEQAAIETHAGIVIDQVGSDNVAEARQNGAIEATASIQQGGERNRVTLYQSQSYAEATVHQNGADNVVGIEQSGGFFPDAAEIYQEGDRNVLTLDQLSEDGVLTVSRQLGEDNAVTIYQSQADNYGDMFIDLAITGNQNTVNIRQEFNSNGNLILRQSGDFYQLNAEQGGEDMNASITSINGDNNTDDILQLGGVGTLTIERAFTDFSAAQVTHYSPYTSNSIQIQQTYSTDVFAGVYQDNGFTLNASVAQQQSTGSTATILQTYGENGSENLIAEIGQLEGTAYSLADITQSGVDNSAFINQTGALNSEAVILQSGLSGEATIYQNSLGETAPNMAHITQQGAGYTAAISQAGGGNNASISQF